MPTPFVQPWKIADSAANKHGDCKTVYTVTEKMPKSTIRALNPTSSINQPVKSKKKYEVKETYTGEWLNNQRHGFGRLRSADSLYEGQFANGKKHGDGTLFVIEQSINQSINQSSSHNQPPSNQSLNKSFDQSINQFRQVYTGEWKNDQRNGRGIQFHSEGARHEGNFFTDVPHGYGTYFFINGDTLTGEWKFGHQNGFGSLCKNNGDLYEGDFVRGKREGSGLYFYAQKGQLFDGEWIDDQPATGIILSTQEYLKLNQSINQLDSSESSELSDQSISRPSTDRPSTSRPASGSLIQALLTASAIDQSINQSIELPILRLENADQILSQEIQEILIDRSVIRSLPPIHCGKFHLFADQSINQSLIDVFVTYLTDKEAETAVIPKSINLSTSRIECSVTRTLLLDCWEKCKHMSINQSINPSNCFSTGALTPSEINQAYYALGKTDPSIKEPINQSDRIISPPVGAINQSTNQSMRFNEFTAAFWLCVQTRRFNEAKRQTTEQQASI